MALVDLKTWKESKRKPTPRPILLPRQIVVRLSDTDAEKIETMAETAGVTISEIVRQLIDSARVVDPSAIRDTLKELHRIGSNINQIAHVCNRQGLTSTVATHLTPACNDIRIACNELLERIR